MGKKRKRQYVSREQLLTKTSSQRNVRSDVVVLETNKSIGTLERRFCRKLQVPGERDILVALVQFNDICLMVLPEPVAAEAVVFSVSASEISGKKKKGAQVLCAGDIVCTLKLPNGAFREVRTPVGGQVLEINEQLERNPNLLLSDHEERGYITVIFPDTEIPDVHSVAPSGDARVMSSAAAFVCYAWTAGKCSRGDKCKFEHPARGPDEKKARTSPGSGAVSDSNT